MTAVSRLAGLLAMVALAASPRPALAAGDPVNGGVLFNSICSVCHSGLLLQFALRAAGKPAVLQNAIATVPQMNATPAVRALTLAQITDITAYLATLVSPPPPAGPDLNQHGLTGSYFEPATDGQGFEIEVFPNLVAPGTALVQMSWFTFDTAVGGAERQRWYTLSGSAVGGAANAPLTIFQNTGGNFNAPPVTNGVAVGTATLNFDSCSSGQLEYRFSDGSGRSGTIPFTRITQNVTCSMTSARPTNPDFALSGNWFNATTSGQGFVVEVNPNNGAVFVPWYTYAPSGGASEAGQRWYTASGSFTPGSRSIPIALFETTGGAFDMPTAPPPKSVQVGTGTLAFQSCTTATFSYNFTGGTSSGMSGVIALTRIGPTPPGCAF